MSAEKNNSAIEGKSRASSLAPWLWIALLLIAVLVNPGPQIASAQTNKIPVSVDLTTSKTEVQAGESIRVTVTLKNADGRPTSALEPTVITLKTELLPQLVRLTVPAGTAVVSTELRLRRPGVATVEAKAAKLASGTALVAVTGRPERPVRPIERLPAPRVAPTVGAMERRAVTAGETMRVVTPRRLPREAAERRAPAEAPIEAPARRRAEIEVRRLPAGVILALTPVPEAPAPTPPPVAAPPPPTPAPAATPVAVASTLFLDVQPPHVHPQRGAWVAEVRAVRVDESGVPVKAEEELPVQFAAEIGQVEPRKVSIPSGSSTHVQEVRITSSRSGRDTVHAWPLARPASESTVEYEAPIPARLRVVALPPRVVNSGKSPVTVTVLLVDEMNHPADFADRDVSIALRSTRGDLSPRTIAVRRGDFSGEATLASATAGEALITASAVGMDDDNAKVQFMFPWLLILLASIGGLGGSLVRDLNLVSSRPWKTRIGKDLVVGGVMGLVFYGLTLFGAVGSIPKTALPINITLIPTVNELGALILGFLGGYFGRQLLRSPVAADGT